MNLSRKKAWAATQQKASIGEDAPFTLTEKPLNSFLRRIIYQEFSDAEELRGCTLDKRPEDNVGARGLATLRCTFWGSAEDAANAKKLREDAEHEQKVAAFDSAYGLGKIIAAIAHAKCPLVVHNGFLDILHTFEKFVAPLPEDVETFRTAFHSRFPIVYDTRHVVLTASKIEEYRELEDLVPSATLGDAYESTRKEAFAGTHIALAKDFNRYQSSKDDEESPDFAHEAGYDAYMTGSLLLRLGSWMRRKGEKSAQEKFSAFTNRLNLMRMDASFFLEKENLDTHLDSPGCLYIENFPRDISTTQIVQLFRPYTPERIGVWWKSKTSACVLLPFSNDEMTAKIEKVVADANAQRKAASSANSRRSPKKNKFTFANVDVAKFSEFRNRVAGATGKSLKRKRDEMQDENESPAAFDAEQVVHLSKKMRKDSEPGRSDRQARETGCSIQ